MGELPPNNAELDRTACAVADAAHAAQASATADDIVCAANIAENPYKRDFPLLANHPDLVFLDSAATAQRPAVVLDAQRRFYEEMNANALRGLYRLSVEATEAIENRPPARGSLHRRTRRARHRADAQRVGVAQHRGEGVRPHRARAGRRGVHHHHGAPLEPDSVAAGLPRGRREAGVPVPRRKRRHHARGNGREDRPEDEDPVRRARVRTCLACRTPSRSLAAACTRRAATWWSTARSPRRTSTLTCRKSTPTSSPSARTSCSARSAWACCGAATSC